MQETLRRTLLNRLKVRDEAAPAERATYLARTLKMRPLADERLFDALPPPVTWKKVVDAILAQRTEALARYRNAAEEYRQLCRRAEETEAQMQRTEVTDERLRLHLKSLLGDAPNSDDEGDVLSSFDKSFLFSLEVRLEGNDAGPQESNMVKAHRNCIFNEYMFFPLQQPSAVLHFTLRKQTTTSLDQRGQAIATGSLVLDGLENMIPRENINVPLAGSASADLTVSVRWQYDTQGYYRGLLQSLESRKSALQVAAQVQQANIDEVDKQLFGYTVENMKWSQIITSPNAAMDASLNLMQRVAKRDIHDSIQISLLLALIVSSFAQFARGNFIETITLLICLWHNNEPRKRWNKKTYLVCIAGLLATIVLDFVWLRYTLLILASPEAGGLLYTSKLGTIASVPVKLIIALGLAKCFKDNC